MDPKESTEHVEIYDLEEKAEELQRNDTPISDQKSASSSDSHNIHGNRDENESQSDSHSVFQGNEPNYEDQTDEQTYRGKTLEQAQADDIENLLNHDELRSFFEPQADPKDSEQPDTLHNPPSKDPSDPVGDNLIFVDETFPTESAPLKKEKKINFGDSPEYRPLEKKVTGTGILKNKALVQYQPEREEKRRRTHRGKFSATKVTPVNNEGEFRTSVSSPTRKTRNSSFGKGEEKGQKEQPNLFRSGTLGTIRKVVGAIRILKKRAGIVDLNSLKDAELSIINDWAWQKKSKFDEEERVNGNMFVQMYHRAGTLAKNMVFKSNLYLSCLNCSKLLRKRLQKIQVISPNHKIKLAWDIFNLLILLWNFFYLSVGIFFGVPFTDIFLFTSGEFTQIVYPIFLVLIFVTQVIDLVLNFNTGFYKNGELVLDRGQIYRHYHWPGLYLDCIGLFAIVLQLVSFQSEHLGDTHHAFQVLFFVKYTNIRRIIANLEDFLVNDDFLESLFSLVGLTIKTLGIAHTIACFWHGLAYFNTRYQRTWLDGLDFISPAWTSRYTFSIYWALTTMTTIGYGDISPRNEGEALLCMAVMMIGSALFGYMISSISSVLEKFEMKKRQLKTDIRIFNKYMQRKNIESDLQVRVRKYFEFMWQEEFSENSEKEEDLLQRLSSSLREEVLLQSHGKFLQNFPVLCKNFSQKTLRKFIYKLKQMRCTPEEVIYEESEVNEGNLYMLAQGDIELSIKSKRRDETECIIRRVMTGETFGEMSFFIDKVHDSTAKCKTFCTIYVLRKEDFLEIITESQEDYESFCMLRDKAVIYGHTSDFHVKCSACLSPKHVVQKCPQLTLQLSTDFVLAKHIKNPFQERKAKLRADNRVIYHALKEIRKIQEDAEDMKDFINELEQKEKMDEEGNLNNFDEGAEENEETITPIEENNIEESMIVKNMENEEEVPMNSNERDPNSPRTSLSSQYSRLPTFIKRKESESGPAPNKALTLRKSMTSEIGRIFEKKRSTNDALKRDRKNSEDKNSFATDYTSSSNSLKKQHIDPQLVPKPSRFNNSQATQQAKLAAGLTFGPGLLRKRESGESFSSGNMGPSPPFLTRRPTLSNISDEQIRRNFQKLPSMSPKNFEIAPSPRRPGVVGAGQNNLLMGQSMMQQISLAGLHNNTPATQNAQNYYQGPYGPYVFQASRPQNPQAAPMLQSIIALHPTNMLQSQMPGNFQLFSGNEHELNPQMIFSSSAEKDLLFNPEMDQWKNFSKYFVHNNLDNVVQQINAVEHKRRKKLALSASLRKRVMNVPRTLFMKKFSSNEAGRKKTNEFPEKEDEALKN